MNANVKNLSHAGNLAINAVRAVAALLVVLGHIRHLYFLDYSQTENRGAIVQAFYLLGSLGRPAVIVFFVLSGFWVGGSVIRALERGSFNVAFYSSARLTRLWIVLVPAIVLTQILDRVGTSLFPASDIYAGSESYHGTLPSSGAVNNLDLLTTFGNVFFVQGIHVDAVGNDTPLWSLSYEFWYYLMFPAALLIFARQLAIKWRLLSAIVFIAGAIIAGPAVLVLLPTWVLGALIAWKQEPLMRWWRSIPAVFGGLFRAALAVALVIASALTIATDRPGAMSDYVVASLAGMLLIALATDTQSTVVRLVLTPLGWAAGWSYSLYATHLPVIAFIAAFVVPKSGRRLELLSAEGIATGIGVLVVALVVGFAFWSLTERNTNYLRRRIVSLRKNDEDLPTAS